MTVEAKSRVNRFCSNRFALRDCAISLQTSILSVLKTYLNSGPQKYTVELHSICSVYMVDISMRFRVKKRAIARYFEKQLPSEKNSLL